MRIILITFLIFLFIVISFSFSFALPEKAYLQEGIADINRVDENTLNIHQNQEKAIINWQSFSVAPQETVQFFQPSPLAVALNRVTGNLPSEIFGNLLANGQIFLINPNGILFGRGAKIDVKGLVASTLDISDTDFLSGKYLFYQNPQFPLAAVINQGEIKIKEGGYLALISPFILQDGVIEAPLGQVEIAGCREAVLDISGNGLINFSLGKINENGDSILNGMGASSNIPFIEAEKIVVEGNNIKLLGAEGTVINNGKITTEGEGNKGGKIKLNSTRATLLSCYSDLYSPYGFIEVSSLGRLKIDGSIYAPYGTLLFDPTNISIINDASGDGYDPNETGDETVGEEWLEAQQGNQNIILMATNDITLENLSDGILSMATQSGYKFSLQAGGDIVFADTSDKITTNNGNIELNAEGSITLGNLDAGTGDITIEAGDGDITIRSIKADEVEITARDGSILDDSTFTGEVKIEDIPTLIEANKITLTAAENIGDVPESEELTEVEQFYYPFLDISLGSGNLIAEAEEGSIYINDYKSSGVTYTPTKYDLNCKDPDENDYFIGFANLAGSITIDSPLSLSDNQFFSAEGDLNINAA
ncbi:MAG: filamentous hemagglutinin N-terminal domain-containing protein, partial [Candidatus Omnitrophica bacterium]|nr:filamentous hemagglutinin N-terminal domain-containing protein [Candidatus Omnitrophota bacterium]